MGDPRQIRRKYDTPKHPWQAERLEMEKEILIDYSLKNKKEIWKMQSVLKGYTNQAKRLANSITKQAQKEKEQLINKLFKFGLMHKNAEIDDVLGLTIKNILDRRLQTMVYKLRMSNTQKQARQFIVHGHVFVADRKISVPSYLVSVDEESKIKFKDGSDLIGKFGKKEEEEKPKKTESSENKKEKKGELLGKAHAKEDAKKEGKEDAKGDEKSHSKDEALGKPLKKEAKTEKQKIKKIAKNKEEKND